MGTQALPANLTIELDEALIVQGAEGDALRAVVPPTTYPDIASWTTAMRTHQASVLKTMIEALRVLKYTPNGGFCAGLWRSAGPGLTRALIDADGTKRPALDAVQRALAPILPVLYPATDTLPARSTATLGLHICNDHIVESQIEVRATISDQRGVATKRWSGQVAGDNVEFIDDVAVRGGRIGDEMTVEIEVIEPDSGRLLSTNSYRFVAS